MDIHSSTQIAKFNQVFGPNPFNTGPPIPPPLLATLFEIEREVLDSEGSTPDLSSSPTSTAPSSPQSSRSALSLEDPEIRKIWEDPRFGPVVHNDTPPELNSFIPAYPFEEEVYTLLDTPPFLKEGSLGRNYFTQAGTLNPLAQPFVPCFTVQDIQHSIGMDQVSTFYDDSTLLTPLNFGDGDGHYGPPDSSTSSHSAAQFDSPSVLDPLYPPGLPLPRNFRKLRGTPAYSSILVEALLPIHDNLTRHALLQPIFDQIEVWDLFTLRELTSALMAAAFGDEHDLILPCSGKACPNHGDDNIEIEGLVVRDAITLPEEVFFQVVADFAKMILQNSGQFFVDMFLMQVIDSIFSRFISYFDSYKPDSLNTYYKTHQVPPCTSYILSAFSLCKTIAFLYQQSVVQRVDVSRCIALLLRDLMSVEHLHALRFIILGSGVKFWDPPSSVLSTSVPDENADSAPASPSNFALPPIKQQAKAKLCRDITMFCSKLDGYKIKRGQSGCASLRGQKWNSSGESYREMIKEITDTVNQWEKELIEVIDHRDSEELPVVSTSQSEEDDN